MQSTNNVEFTESPKNAIKETGSVGIEITKKRIHV